MAKDSSCGDIDIDKIKIEIKELNDKAKEEMAEVKKLNEKAKEVIEKSKILFAL